MCAETDSPATIVIHPSSYTTGGIDARGTGDSKWSLQQRRRPCGGCLDGVKRFDAAEARFKALLSRLDPRNARDPSFHQEQQTAELLDEMAAGVEMIREGLPITKELVSCVFI